jgi:hypothetical protein
LARTNLLLSRKANYLPNEDTPTVSHTCDPPFDYQNTDKNASL